MTVIDMDRTAAAGWICKWFRDGVVQVVSFHSEQLKLVEGGGRIV